MTKEEKDMIDDIDGKLDDLNTKNKFSDTNLVARNLEQISISHKTQCSYILKSYCVLSALIVISRVKIYFFI